MLAMSEELLPCPFCGNEAHLMHSRSYDNNSESWIIDCWSILCNNNNCDMTPSTGFREEASDARAAWNRRAKGDNDV